MVDAVAVTSAAEWRAWLQEHHATSPGTWLTTFKKAAGDRYVSYDEVVEEALCFGWVDSRPRKLDDLRTQLLITPRNPSSAWSAANKARVERLERDGRMAPAGREAVEVARGNGAWDRLDEVERLEEPQDLADALDAAPGARGHWDAFPPSTRRGILEWILSAKRPQTRAARVERTAADAAEGVRANQWPPRDRG